MKRYFTKLLAFAMSFILLSAISMLLQASGVEYQNLPANWSYTAGSDSLTVSTLGVDQQYFFSNKSLGSDKSYIYKTTLNFSAAQLYGSARLIFRFAEYTNCQALYVQPGYGLIYGTDYWCGSNNTQPLIQPSISLNTDYDLSVITTPTSVSVYLNNNLVLSKTGVSSAGLKVGIGGYNAVFAMKNTSVEERTSDPDNLLDQVLFSNPPAGVSYNELAKTLTVSTLSEFQLPFSNATIDSSKTYIYRYKIKFSEQAGNGSARIMFRYGGYFEGQCQMLYVQPGYGLIYGTDYWCGSNFTAPSVQPFITVGNEYEVGIVTSPDSVSIYLNNNLMISKTGVSSTGLQVGIASSSAKFTMSDISLSEQVTDAANMLDNIVLSGAPSGVTYNVLSKSIIVDTNNEFQAIFDNVTIDSQKGYSYKFKLNFRSTGSGGSARIMFRYGGYFESQCQMLYVQPGYGLISGNNYWAGTNATYVTPLDIGYNTDYEFEIITLPSSLKVYLNKALVIDKKNIVSSGLKMGVASSNAKFVMTDISLKEMPDSFSSVMKNFTIEMPNENSNILTGITVNSTAGSLIRRLCGDLYDVENAQVINLAENDRVYTGADLAVTVNSATKNYEIAVKGDVNGDASTSILDLLAAKELLLSPQEGETLQTLAANVNETDGFDINDLIEMRSKLLGKDVSGILAKYSDDYLNLSSYELDKYLLPYWEGDLVFNEQVLMVEDQNGVSAAPLLYNPLKIVSVKDSTLSIEYQEGKDWVLENGKLKIISGGSINPLRYDEFYPTEYNVNSSWHRYINGQLTSGFIRIGAGGYFQPKLLNITYIHDEKWQGAKPTYEGDLIPKTMAKLNAGQSTNIVVYGDSISHGDEATGCPQVNVAPHMPVWSEMAKAKLNQVYGGNVNITNLSVGGWTSSQGINGGYECYLQQNVPGAKVRVGGLKPDLVVIGFGQNDGDLSPLQLKTNIQTIMNEILSVSPDTEFIILGVICPNPEVSAGDVPSYRFYKNQVNFDETLKTLEKQGVAFLPLKAYQDIITRNKRMQDLLANNINHPNDFFYRFYAQLFCKALISNN